MNFDSSHCLCIEKQLRKKIHE